MKDNNSGLKFAKFALLGCAFLAIVVLVLVPEAPIVEAPQPAPLVSQVSDILSASPDTFGYETQGANWQTCYNRISGSYFSPATSGTLDSITAYVYDTGGPAYYKFAIYRKSDGSLVDYTNDVMYPAGDGWATGPVVNGASITAGTEYYLVAWGDDPYCRVAYDTVTGAGGYQSQTYNSFPDPWSPTSEDKKYSIYASYTPAAVYPTKPQLYAPENDSILTDNTPYFEWTVGQNADNHRLLVDNDSDFSSPVENVLLGATDNTHTMATELSEDNYYWKVVAINSDGENGSDVWTFEVLMVPPSKPMLYSPENGSAVLDTPTFEWTMGSYADNHRLEIDNDSDFSSPVENCTIVEENSYTIAVGNALAIDNYWWRVWAVNAHGENCSDTWQFTVENLEPTLIWSYYDSGGYAVDIGMSSDSNYMAGGTELSHKLYFWDNADNVPNWTYKLGNEVKELAMSDDGKYVVVGVSGGDVILFGNTDNTPIWKYDIGVGSPFVHISADGTRIVASGGGSCYLFDNNDNTPIWTFSEGDFSTATVSSDGNYVIAIFDNYIRKFTDNDNTSIWKFAISSLGDVYDVDKGKTAISENGTYSVVLVQAIGTEPNVERRLLLFKDDNNPIWSFESISSISDPVGLDITPSGHRISSSLGTSVAVFGNVDNIPIFSWGLGSPNWSNDLNPTGKYLVVGSGKLTPSEIGHFWFFSVDDNELRSKYNLESLGWDVEITDDGTKAFCSSDHTRKFFYFDTGLVVLSVENVYAPATVNVDEEFNIQIEVQDPSTLADIDEVWLKIYENTKDNTENYQARDCYGLKWTRSGGFSEVGPDNTSPYDHLVVENCSAGNDSLQTDNWTFAIKLGKTASPNNSWSVWARVVDNSDASDNETYQNQFDVNKYIEISLDDSQLSFSGKSGENVQASENPTVVTVTSNDNFDIKVKLENVDWECGSYTIGGDNTKADSDSSPPYDIDITTSYQTIYSGIEWGDSKQRSIYWTLCIPQSAIPCENYTNLIWVMVIHQ